MVNIFLYLHVYFINAVLCEEILEIIVLNAFPNGRFEFVCGVNVTLLETMEIINRHIKTSEG